MIVAQTQTVKLGTFGQELRVFCVSLRLTACLKAGHFVPEMWPPQRPLLQGCGCFWRPTHLIGTTVALVKGGNVTANMGDVKQVQSCSSSGGKIPNPRFSLRWNYPILMPLRTLGGLATLFLRQTLGRQYGETGPAYSSIEEVTDFAKERERRPEVSAWRYSAPQRAKICARGMRAFFSGFMLPIPSCSGLICVDGADFECNC